MCGIAGAVGGDWRDAQLHAMVSAQRHRGPDGSGIYRDPAGMAGLGHNRLSIIDLSTAGRQPMCSRDERYWIVLNGEIYNYVELRAELASYPFRSRTDTEVILAAYERWGEACLDRFIGMFAFLIWDQVDRRLFAARDRFGVKPLYYTERPERGLVLASEIKAIRAAGVPLAPDERAWATYLAHGLTDWSDRTFWAQVQQLPPGHKLVWRDGRTVVRRWYDLAERVGPDLDARAPDVVAQEYRALLEESVRLRFRSDVPVGINLSGGLDSSTLLGVVQAVQGSQSDVKAFTFVTGDDRYDELPWVRQMLQRTHHPSVLCELAAADVPRLAELIQSYQDEPFGGVPTIAYSRIFERAREEGVIVLLDGQGMDEQWAGYDYYHAPDETTTVVQGTQHRAVRPECLVSEFRALAEQLVVRDVFPDALRRMQYRDARFAKIPRALRYNDRVSMQHSTELREPFLDHRLFELALRQPADRKMRNGTRKWLLRKVAGQLLPGGVLEAPKRPLQTPQREWLRGPLRDWATAQIESMLAAVGGAWLDPDGVRRAWLGNVRGESDNSFYVWQWISGGMMARALPSPEPRPPASLESASGIAS